ncbi:T-cell activation Rho GTPase-activating protein isoform X2 [Pseudophryne corroboree]|uniref:T-cell activation Rho GTPase-activating protein isoform X2 n=1 Tax=Pseudophryne corroboree TaxID=495146 RepID=UPI0030815697
MSIPHPRNKARRGSYDGILLNKNPVNHKYLTQRRCSAPSLVFPKSLSKPWSTGRSGTSFRLKHRVELSQMIVLSCDEEEDDEDTCALHISPKNALIFIWPYNGSIITYRSCEVKELWLDTLVWQIREVGGLEGTHIPCARLLMKVLTGCNASKALLVSNMDNSIECHTEEDAKKWQLLADMFSYEGFYHVIESNKKRKAVSWPFTLRRSSTLSESSSQPELKTTLFDQPLSFVLPKEILDILTILRGQGPLTEGIFRKAANEKARKELKEDLNCGRNRDLKSESIHLLAVVFKDFLRGIPNQLLSSELYNKWICALEKPSLDEKIEAMRRIADKLPKPNLIVLRYLICVLHHISKASDINKMDSRNLSVCIAPNMLIPHVDKNLPLEMQKELNDKVTQLVEFFIDNCFELFGDNISQLLSASEQDSLENIDTAEMSFPQNDSAYDSTDPDHEFHANTSTRYQDKQCRHNRAVGEECTVDQDCDLSVLPVARIKLETHGIDRRCSEPYIFHSQNDTAVAEQKLTRSQDDVTIRKQRLPFTDEEFPTHTLQKYCDRALYKRNMPKGLTINTSYASDIADDFLANASSTCSVDSSFSDCSVFTSSPLVSPLSPKKNDLSRHKSFSMKCKDLSDIVKVGRELKKHSNSFCYVNHKKMVTKTQSWGPDGDNAGLQREGLSRSFRNKSQAECNGVRERGFQQPQVIRMRPQSARKISVDEVFRMVDQRNPGKPPSYEEAIHKNVSSYKGMTVQTMRDNVSHDDYTTSYSSPDSTHAGNKPNSNDDVQKNNAYGVTQLFHQPEKAKSDLVRTKSESCQRIKHESLNRRCSQPIFEIYDQIQYAKESYV